MIRNKLFRLAFCATVVALSPPAYAQQPAKVHHVCFLSSRPGIEVREEAFRQGMRELGYTEGKNLDLEWRFAGGDASRIPALSRELIRAKCDVLVAGGTEATKGLKSATTTIPMVFTVASDPVGAGLVASLSHPGGNVSGLSLDAPGLNGKRLEILKEVIPGLSRTGVLYHRASPASKAFLSEIEAAARTLKVQLRPHGVETANEITEAFNAMSKEHIDGLVRLPTSFLMVLRKPINDLAIKYRLPTIYDDRVIVEDGGLLSYGPDITDLYRRSASYVDKILKGAKPADLPVEQPTKFELVVNLRTAKEIGVTIPPNVLARADKVIR